MPELTTEAMERQSAYPNLLKGGPTFIKGGPSPNPSGGRSPYQRALDAAIERQEAPELVCQVIAAMREQALEKGKASPAAAKVYLGAVGVDLNKAPAKVELDNAPKEVLNWITENLV